MLDAIRFEATPIPNDTVDDSATDPSMLRNPFFK